MPQVLITGASGFLAKSVIKELKQQELEVIAVSRHRTDTIGVKNILVQSYFDIPAYDGAVCIHLAEPSLVSQGQENSVDSVELAKSLLNKGFRKIIYASSAVVYGSSDNFCHTEESLVHPDTAYASRKIKTEQIFRDHVIARISNVYGNGMSSKNVFSDILAQLDKDGPLIVRNAAPIRDYVHVKDVARALVKMTTMDKYGIFNVGTGIGTSVHDLANIILKSRNMSNKVIHSLSGPSLDADCLVLNVSKIEKEFGWRPEIELNSGVEDISDSTKV